MANYAKKLGKKTAAVIYDTSDDYSKGLRDSFKATAEKLGIAVAADEGFAKGAVDFRPAAYQYQIEESGCPLRAYLL